MQKSEMHKKIKAFPKNIIHVSRFMKRELLGSQNYT